MCFPSVWVWTAIVRSVRWVFSRPLKSVGTPTHYITYTWAIGKKLANTVRKLRWGPCVDKRPTKAMTTQKSSHYSFESLVSAPTIPSRCGLDVPKSLHAQLPWTPYDR